MDFTVVLADNFTLPQFLLYLSIPVVFGAGYYFLVARPLRRPPQNIDLNDEKSEIVKADKK
jgi:hypothetical protein